MSYVPPCKLLTEWLDSRPRNAGGRLAMLYEDVVDVLTAFISAIPVNEEWYLAEYPAVADLVRNSQTETAKRHFRMHGYFENRRPFVAGWNGFVEPVPFDRLKPLLRVAPTSGGLTSYMFQDDFIELIKQLLKSVPVDGAWYSSYYPIEEIGIIKSDIETVSAHYVEIGYFKGWLPADVVVDAEWYKQRYEHVRHGLELGHAADAKDHFLKIGYREGCRPIPPS